ncbi:hypothetical protein Tamer19_50450 [Cupriavidus sp. TA19]|uniref:hypothetical protein n=1 Tax=unclassified Cupriavidus TaxID=2640874 RepID=UPI000E2ECDBD|nr:MULTISPECIES: hypothetical protein [unclassified Cupriavidus]BDB28244.1 hypothetical protein CTP10_R56550 [Cupriavidus sp. P-10]GLC95636.1 hypothetical protein Tamer19_50450 [Cupriavidus sp. TA19]
MQVLADTLYRQPAQAKSQAKPQAKSSVRPAAEAAREVDYYARMGSGRSLSARVREYFARGWTLYLDNARAVAPLVHL